MVSTGSGIWQVLIGSGADDNLSYQGPAIYTAATMCILALYSFFQPYHMHVLCPRKQT